MTLYVSVMVTSRDVLPYVFMSGALIFALSLFVLFVVYPDTVFTAGDVLFSLGIGALFPLSLVALVLFIVIYYYLTKKFSV